MVQSSFVQQRKLAGAEHHSASAARQQEAPDEEKTKAISLRWVFSTLKGQPYSYEAIKSAWARARERAGLANAHFHDLRAMAVTDVDEVKDIKAAQGMGGHSTQAQTADYIRHRKPKKVGATR